MKKISRVDHFAGTREQTDFYHISDKATKPNAKYGSDRWTLSANGKEQEVHMGNWLIKDTLGATYIIPDEEMSTSLNHTTEDECPYCHFQDEYTWSTDKKLIDEDVKPTEYSADIVKWVNGVPHLSKYHCKDDEVSITLADAWRYGWKAEVGKE